MFYCARLYPLGRSMKVAMGWRSKICDTPTLGCWSASRPLTTIYSFQVDSRGEFVRIICFLVFVSCATFSENSFHNRNTNNIDIFLLCTWCWVEVSPSENGDNTLCRRSQCYVGWKSNEKVSYRIQIARQQWCHENVDQGRGVGSSKNTVICLITM